MIDSEQSTADASDPLEVIQIAAATLVRNLELLSRRSGVYSELDRAEYLLLRTVDQIGPADICTLAGALGVDPSTAGRQVAAMRAKELVDRSPAPADRRRSIVSLTDEGRRRMVATTERGREAVGRLVGDWSEEDQWTLSGMFIRYNEAITRQYLDPLT